jgi:hypothetical protein
VFRERVGALGSAASVVGLFVARSATGEALRFCFRLHAVVSADGSVRVERSVADCTVS